MDAALAIGAVGYKDANLPCFALLRLIFFFSAAAFYRRHALSFGIIEIGFYYFYDLNDSLVLTRAKLFKSFMKLAGVSSTVSSTLQSKMSSFQIGEEDMMVS